MKFLKGRTATVGMQQEKQKKGRERRGGETAAGKGEQGDLPLIAKNYVWGVSCVTPATIRTNLIGVCQLFIAQVYD